MDVQTAFWLKSPTEFCNVILMSSRSLNEILIKIPTELLCPPPWGVDILFLLFSPSDVRRPASDVRRHAWFPLI